MGLVFGTNKLKTSHFQFLQFRVDKKLFVSIWKITRRGVAATTDSSGISSNNCNQISFYVRLTRLINKQEVVDIIRYKDFSEIFVMVH